MYVKSTKEVLADSFRELAVKKPVSKITVTGIAENCGMTPQTFYNHFTDKFDLIAWIYNTDMEKGLRSCRAERRGWRAALAERVAYFAQNRDFITNALKHTRGQDAFARQIAQAHIDAVCEEARRVSGAEQLSEDTVNVIRVYCFGASGYLFAWLFDNMPLPQEKLVALLDRCMPEPLRAILDGKL